MTHAATLVPTPPADRATARRAGLCWAALAAVLVFEVLQVNRRISHGHSGDFRHFYYAARALLDHADLYRSGTGGYLYPPLIAFLYTPVARLSYTAAQRVMVVVNAGFTVAGLAVAGRAMLARFDAPRRADLWAGVALLACVANVDKVHLELQMFQTNALMFLLFALSLSWLDRRPWLAGGPLGAVLNIKYLSLAMVPWLLVRRRWATAASTVAWAVGFAVLPAVESGWRANVANLRVAYGGLLTMVGLGAGTAGPTEQANVEDITAWFSCSFTSAMARVAKFHGRPLWAGLLGAGLIAVAVLAAVLWVYRRRCVPAFAWPSFGQQQRQPWRAAIGLEFVAVLMVTLMFSPQTNTRHLFLALLLTTAAAAMLLAGRAAVPRVPLGVAVVVMFLTFVLPPGNRFTEAHHWSLLWLGVGGPCWGLLALLLCVLDDGLLGAENPNDQDPKPNQ